MTDIKSLLSKAIKHHASDLCREDLTDNMIQYAEMVIKRAQESLNFIDNQGDETVAWNYFIGLSDNLTLTPA